MDNNKREYLLEKLISCNKSDLLKGFEMINTHGPKSLYKYRTGIDIELEIRTLKSNTVWASKVQEFNDPYDCAFLIDISNTQTNRQIKQRIGDEWSKTMQETTCVASFTETVESILMWSHYAKNHKGFCIEYDINDIINSRCIYPVFYNDTMLNPLAISTTDMNKSLHMKLLFNKATDWDYEKEWRIIETLEEKEGRDKNIKGKLVAIPTPKALYMGCKVEKLLKEVLIEYAAENKLKLYQMKMKKGSFVLYYEQVNICIYK